ncbi:MAG: cyclic nucleotide-binding domain-containing protein [Rhodospirillales bacterium]|nr:cyclic nucleotide-binding domain-containing protein [Rhodospirillales bacterium]
MGKTRYAAGEIIFREGERSDRIYIVGSGEVELTRTGPHGTVIVAVLKPGSLFGEVGNAGDEHHTVTARTSEPTEIDAIPHDALRTAGRRKSPAGVSSGDHRLAAMAGGSPAPDRRGPDGGGTTFAKPPVPVGKPRAGVFDGTIRICPDSPAAARQLPREGITVDEFPFRIGRRTTKSESRHAMSSHLELDEEQPFYLSRLHFAVDETAWGPVVVDCGSRLGTRVNGELVGGTADEVRAPLNPGENTIVPGNEKSTLRFKIVVDPAKNDHCRFVDGLDPARPTA